jgi:hypothetical protein
VNVNGLATLAGVAVVAAAEGGENGVSGLRAALAAAAGAASRCMIGIVWPVRGPGRGPGEITRVEEEAIVGFRPRRRHWAACQDHDAVHSCGCPVVHGL